MSLSNKLAITDVDLKGKRVLIRVCRPYSFTLFIKFTALNGIF